MHPACPHQYPEDRQLLPSNSNVVVDRGMMFLSRCAPNAPSKIGNWNPACDKNAHYWQLGSASTHITANGRVPAQAIVGVRNVEAAGRRVGRHREVIPALDDGKSLRAATLTGRHADHVDVGVQVEFDGV